jgi:hypothetical protein
MKNYIPTNWGWYVATLVIFGPMLLIWGMDTDWVARLIGLVILWGMIPIGICLWYALGPRKNLTSIGDPVSVWPTYIIKVIGAEGAVLGTRGLILLAGLAFSFSLTIPLLRDLVVLTNNNFNPLEVTSLVLDTRSLSGNISEEVVLEEYTIGTETSSFTAWYFSPHHIMKGNTYKFLYLPNSQIILEATPVTKKKINMLN